MQITTDDIMNLAPLLALELRFKDGALDALEAQNTGLQQRVAELEAQNTGLQQRVAELQAQDTEPIRQGALHTHTCDEVHPQQDIHHPDGHPHRHDHEA